MAINYSKRGLRLGYLIRCDYTSSGGSELKLRLSGPASRVGTGYTGPDPDDAATWPAQRYWRAGSFDVSMIEDLGKLSQYIAVPGQFRVVVPLGYPVDPRTEVADDSGDADLRADALEGRWRARPFKVWIIDLDTGDTEERFRGFVDRPPDLTPSSFSLVAREYIELLNRKWPTVQFPVDDSAWTETRASAAADQLYYPGTYDINPDHRLVEVGGIIGKGYAASPYEATWRECLPYGQRGLVGGSTRYWCHVSAQENCYVHEVAVEVLGLPGGGIFKTVPTATFLNDEAAAGPLGTNFTFVTASGVSFPFTQGFRVFARVSGPEVGQPDPTPVGNGAKTEYIESATATVRARIETILEDFIETPGSLSLGADVFGGTALSDFAAQRPISAQEWERMQCAVPRDLTKTPPSLREVLTDLFATAPADFVQRYDSVTDERRWFPLWRRPSPSSPDADYQIRVSDLASAGPVAARVLADPRGEYLNRIELTSAAIYVEPLAAASGDIRDELNPEDRRTQIANNPSEQADTTGGGVVARDFAYKIWNHEVSATADGLETAAQVIAAQFSQRQTYVEIELGSRWFQLQLGDTVEYLIHGMPSSVGHVRRLERDLESQTITVTTIHVRFYDTGETGGD